MGKTTKGLVTQIAAVIESSQWYNMKVQDYMSHAPAMLEKGHLVQKFSVRLWHLEATAAHMKELHDMIKEVSVLQKCLRAGSTERLQQALYKKVTTLWTDIEEGSKDDADILHLASQVLLECHLLYPMDEQIQVMSQACGELLSQCGLQRDVEMFSKACSALLEQLKQEPMDKDACAEAMEKLCSGASSLKGQPGTLPGESKALAKDALTQLITIQGNSLLEGCFSMESCLPCAEALCSVVEDTGLSQVTSCLTLAWQVGLCMVKLKAANDEPVESILDGDKSMEKTIELQRTLLKINASKAAVDGHEVLIDKPFWEKVHKIITHASATLNVVNAARARSSLGLLKDAHSRLQDVAGGLAGGKRWQEDCTVTSFQQLHDHAENTLMKTNGKQLVQLAEELKQAMQHILPQPALCTMLVWGYRVCVCWLGSNMSHRL